MAKGISRLVSKLTNRYGRMTRGSTVTNLSSRRKGSRPPGVRYSIKGRR